MASFPHIGVVFFLSARNVFELVHVKCLCNPIFFFLSKFLASGCYVKMGSPRSRDSFYLSGVGNPVSYLRWLSFVLSPGCAYILDDCDTHNSCVCAKLPRNCCISTTFLHFFNSVHCWPSCCKVVITAVLIACW